MSAEDGKVVEVPQGGPATVWTPSEPPREVTPAETGQEIQQGTTVVWTPAPPQK